MRRGLIVCLAVLLVATESLAAPEPLDRIVAVVDQSVVTLSEIRARARPHLQRLKAASPKAPDKAAIDSLYGEVLQQIIDERIVAIEAEARHISVTAEDVDSGIAHVAEANKVTPEQLLAEVDKLGMTRVEYREEVRRQILDGKWTLLVVGPKLQVKPGDEKAYAKAMEEGRTKELARLRAEHYIEVRK